MKNYLYDEFTQACITENIAPSIWATQNGLNKTMPTNLKQGIRPSIETLRKLATCWSVEEKGARIIQAYMKDELERIGLSLDIIQPTMISENADPTINDALRTIENHTADIPNLREALILIANLFKYSDSQKPKIADIMAGVPAFDGLIHNPRTKKKPSA